MIESLDDVWSSREYPLLREAARRIDGGIEEHVYVEALAHDVGVPAEQAQIAVNALYGDGYLTGVMVEEIPGPVVITGVTAKARRELGLWPSPEAAADRLLAALDAMIANASTPEQRTRLQKLRDAVVSAGTQVTIGIATAMLTGVIPGASGS